MRARSANSEVALAGDEEEVDDGFTEKGNANRSWKRLYTTAILITFCLTLCTLAKRLDNAAASAAYDARQLAAAGGGRARHRGPSPGRARRPAPPPTTTAAPRPRVWQRKSKTYIEADMPPFDAPRVNPYRHRKNLKGPLDAGACDAHRRAVPYHSQAMWLVNVSRVYKVGPRVLCVIYTYRMHHATAAKVASQTWLPRCDGALILSDKSDESVGAKKKPHKIKKSMCSVSSEMSPPHFCHISEIKSKQIYKTGAVGVPHEGPEEYNNIWQKTRANWRYVYEYYRDEFDYFHFGGDDLFVLVPNLKAYLASGPIKARNDRGEPLYLGRRFDNQGNKTNLFNFGGSGYTFNRKSLALLYDSFDEPFCRPHLRAPFEDVMVAECFRNGPAHLLPTDTRDKTGAERFHPFTPGRHLRYHKTPDDWYTRTITPSPNPEPP